ncbi:2-hydroxyacid dehydrogenase [Dyella mobilis]|uniref:D-glycerate dehydrogenase n=1 Tax=Dyella mobilis TaxID=1849582 RepID=A0ABS2KJV4_9GAMM|nr:D-glycerate dehydrogenase [Dyella mobilis]MBM7131436.1 D-glycerate dehydrogenase [Dyella mobilis]GLQ96591.1 D-glycerate dehydrogenase [Dyella mobilis]
MSKQQRVWVSRPLFPEVLATLAQHVDLCVETKESKRTPEQLHAKLADVDGAIVGLSDRIDAAAIAGHHRLRAVANLGVGYNNLDLAALTAAGIIATNTPDVLTQTTADYAWALLLAAARRVSSAERWLRAGRWRGGMRFDDWLGVDVHGKTLGILGMGRIGQAVARRASGFDMRVIYHNRSRLPEAVERDCRATWVDKTALLQQADHLVLVLPYGAQSHHAIGAAELDMMKRTAVLVNIARGGIVDDAALAVALRDGRLAAAGLDVFEGEPAVNPALRELDNAVLSPHIASASADTRRAMAQLAADNLLAALGFGPQAGHPPSWLNPEARGRACR